MKRKKIAVLLLSALLVCIAACDGKANAAIDVMFTFDIETTFPIKKAYLDIRTSDMQPIKMLEYAKEGDAPIVKGDVLRFSVPQQDLGDVAKDPIYYRVFCADESLTGGVMSRKFIPMRSEDGKYTFEDWQECGLDVMSTYARKQDAALMADDSLFLVTVTNRTAADVTLISKQVKASARDGHDVTDTSENEILIRPDCCAIFSFDSEIYTDRSPVNISLRTDNAAAEFTTSIHFGQIEHFDLTADDSGFSVTKVK